MSSIISSLFGGGSQQSNLPPTLSVTGGGTSAPFTFGVGDFDLQAIVDAFNRSTQSTQARYNQLGLGGSTMEQQDLGTAPSVTGGLPAQREAVIGQEQTANVGQPALNPALQPQIDQQLGGTAANAPGNTAGATASSLGQLAGLAGKGLGGAAGGISDATAGDAALGLGFLGL